MSKNKKKRRVSQQASSVLILESMEFENSIIIIFTYSPYLGLISMVLLKIRIVIYLTLWNRKNGSIVIVINNIFKSIGNTLLITPVSKGQSGSAEVLKRSK